MILAVDIGNTTTRLALVDCAQLRCRKRVAFPTVHVDRRELTRVWRRLGSASRKPTAVAVSSVVPEAEQVIRCTLASVGVSPVIRIHGRMFLPVRLTYRTPATIGADRLSSAVFCHARYPGRSCVMINAGTALVIDYVSRDGVLRGGTIIPGPTLQLQALYTNTAALPKIRRLGSPPSLPGTHTTACMRAGVLYGLAGAIERIVDEYRRLPGGVDLIAAAGGAWHLLRPLVRLSVVHEPDAVLVGAALCAEFSLRTRCLGKGTSRTGTSPRTELPQ